MNSNDSSLGFTSGSGYTALELEFSIVRNDIGKSLQTIEKPKIEFIPAQIENLDPSISRNFEIT